MGLNKSKGHMYGFITHTFNICKGLCPHDCKYCYVKRFGNLKPVRFDQKELKTDLGYDNFIFVGSSCDMWADPISYDWIEQTIQHCSSYPDNQYLFQSKNPQRFLHFLDDGVEFPKNTIFATTIESNRDYPNISKAPKIMERVQAFVLLGLHKMVTIEPIMDFDLDRLIQLIEMMRPQWVNIGADSKGHKLPEPDGEKIKLLIDELSKFTEIKCKNNLKRLYR